MSAKILFPCSVCKGDHEEERTSYGFRLLPTPACPNPRPQGPGIPGSPYRPSNGSEGDYFQENHCSTCHHNDDDNGCPIFNGSLMRDIGEPGYPSQWVHGEDGWGKCLAFYADPELVRAREKMLRERALYRELMKDVPIKPDRIFDLCDYCEEVLDDEWWPICDNCMLLKGHGFRWCCADDDGQVSFALPHRISKCPYNGAFWGRYDEVFARRALTA
jgi:hypothetical protein